MLLVIYVCGFIRFQKNHNYFVEISKIEELSFEEEKFKIGKSNWIKGTDSKLLCTVKKVLPLFTW